MAGLQKDQRMILQERRLVDSKFTEFIKKLIKTQNEHQHKLPNIEARIKILEDMLEETSHELALEYPEPKKSHGGTTNYCFVLIYILRCDID